MQRAAQQYLRTQVTTTSQGELVVMLYDGAIKFLHSAKELLAANDMAGKGIAISKALDIINELDSSLNIDKGGKLATNLHGLYVFCTNHLVKANLKKDSGMIDDVLRVLGGLRSAYAEIASWPEAQAAAKQAAANIPASAYTPARTPTGIGNGAQKPAPGASARLRSLYAKQAEQSAVPPQQPASSPIPSEPDAPAPSQGAVANGTTSPAPETPAEGNTSPGSFGRKAANLDLYRKFAG